MHTRDLLARRGGSAPIPPRPAAMFEALEERLLLAAAIEPAYEVWGGFTDYRSDPDAVYLYCNIDQQDYDYLGPADATDTFVGEYDFYVIAANHPLGVDAVEGSDGSFAAADPASGNVRDLQYIAGPPDGQSAVVGNISYPASYRGYAIVENPGPWTGLTVHTTPLPPQVLELTVVRESAEYNDEGQWTEHWYGVKAGGIDLEGMTITTPWGDYIDSADYLPGQWGGEFVETFDYTYGVRITGGSEGPERFIEMEWDDLSDPDWSDIEASPAQIDVTYTGGSWAASVDSSTVPVPLETPTVTSPQNWDYDVPLDALIQWDPWSVPPIGEGVGIYFEGEMGPGATVPEAFLPPQASSWAVSPDLAPSAQYYVVVGFVNVDLQISDGAQVVLISESSSAVVFNTVAGAPDLQISDSPLQTIHVDPSSTVLVPVEVFNAGTDPAYGFDVNLYLSTDPTVDATDLLVGVYSVSDLYGDSAYAATVSFYAPIEPGVYYLAALADPGRYVQTEADRSNNWGGALELIVGGPGFTWDRVEYYPGVSTGYPLLTDVADFDGDGRSDLAYLWGDGDTNSHVTILYAPGDAGPREHRDVPLNLPGAFQRALASGDFNFDGRTDLAHMWDDINGDTTVSILYAQPDGTFAAPVDYALGSLSVDFFRELASADFDGDGASDLVWTSGDGNSNLTLNILHGQPGAVNLTRRQDYYLGYSANPDFLGYALIADFDGDGRSDLAFDWVDASNNDRRMLGVLYGQSGGGVGGRTDYDMGFSLQSGYLRSGPTAGDFNGDGRSDLAYVWGDYSDQVSTLTILYGQAGGGMSRWDQNVAHSDLLQSGHFNADDFDDLRMRHPYGDGGVLSVYYGRAASGMAVAERDDASPWWTLEFGELGDFNGDGLTDILELNPDYVTVSFRQPGGIIQGTIYDAGTGAPLEGVAIEVFREGARPPGTVDWNWWDWAYVDSVYTDQAGRYETYVLPERTYHLRIWDGAQPDGTQYVGSNRSYVPVVGNQTTSGVDFHLPQAGFIYGYVYDELGYPIQYADVVVEAEYVEDEEAFDWHNDSTDASGYYEIYLAPTDLEIYPIKVTWASGHAAQIDGSLYAAALGGTRGPDFNLSPGGTIHGFITTTSGYPLSYVNAVEFVAAIDGGTIWGSGETDANGEYWITNVPAGVDVALETEIWPVRAYEIGGVWYAWGSRWIGPFNVAPGETIEVGTLQMPEAVTVSGFVTDPLGDPIAGVNIGAFGRDVFGGEIDLDDDGDVVTDALGHYEFYWIPAGQIGIWGWANGYLDYTSDVELNLAPGEQAAFDFTMSPVADGAVISGSITNFDQVAPINASGITLPYEMIDYDAHGRIEWVGVLAYDPTAPWTDRDLLFVERRLTGDVDVEDGYTDYFAPSANPAGGYRIAVPAGDQALFALREGPVGADGWFVNLSDPLVLSGLSPGEVLSDQDLTIPLGGSSIIGTVSFPEGHPGNLGESSVFILLREVGAPLEGLGRAVAEPGYDDRYSMQYVPAGEYYVYAVADGLAPFASAPFTLDPDSEVQLDIVFGPPGEIHGTKWNDLDGDGAYGEESGLEGWKIFLDDNQNGVHDQGERATLTDAWGDYEFTGLAAGTYYVAEEIPVPTDAGTWEQTYPGGVHEVVLPSDSVVFGIDFGNWLVPLELPDLVVSDLQVISYTTSTITFTYTVTNEGGTPADLRGVTDDPFDNVYMQGFLSEDMILDNQVDPGAGGVYLPSIVLDPAQSISGQTTTYPVANPFLYSHLIVAVDWGDQLPESDEANNTRVAPLPELPDLIVSSLELTSNAAQGGTIDYSYTIANIGGEGPAGNSSFDVATYLSADDVFDESDILLPSGYSAWSYHLAQGWSQDLWGASDLPDPFSLDDYYLIVVADAFPNLPPNYYPGVEEADEDNNWAASSMTVAAGEPELTATYLGSQQFRVAPEDELTFPYRITNDGTGNTTPFHVGLYVSADSTVDGDDELVREIPWGGLDPGASSDDTFTLAAPSEFGTYYYGIWADNQNEVLESVEEDNWSGVFTVEVCIPIADYFPLEVGLARTYRYTQAGPGRVKGTDRTIVSVISPEMVDVNGARTYELRKFYGARTFTNTYYTLDDQGLYLHGQSYVEPKRSSMTEFAPAFPMFPALVGLGEIVTETGPWEGLTLTNRSWSGSYGQRIEVMGFEDVIVPAGTFNALKIRFQITADKTGSGTDVQISDQYTAWLVENLGVVRQEGTWSEAQGGRGPQVWAFSYQLVSEGVSAPDAPDLTAWFDSRFVPPAQIVPGTTMRVPVVIQNIGAQQATGEIAMDFIASGDQFLDEGDFLVDRAENVRINLAPGQSRVVNVNVTFPGEVPPGSYFLLGYVDSDNVIAEHHEDNNIAFTSVASELVHRFGNVGGKRNVALTMPDGFGTPMTFTLRGSGYGEVERDAETGHLSVTFYNTDNRSTATFRTPRRTEGVIEDIFVGRGSVQGMSAETTDLTGSVVLIAPTSLRSLSARTTDLIGDVIADGWIGKIHMDDVTDVDDVAGDHLIEIGAGVAPITLIFDSLGNTSVLSVPPIGSLTATEWVDNDETPDRIVAPWVGKLQIKGRRANPRRGIAGSPGHFGADLVLSGKGAVRNTLNLTRIAGDLYGAHWDITGNMGGLTVGGIVEESTVRTTGSMGALSLGAVVGSDFLAGISSDALRGAEDAQDFVNVDARIQSVSILGLKLPGVEEDPYFFENSNFSAAGIGRVSLLNLWPDNEGEGFGFLALARGDGGGGINSLQYRDTVTGDRWRWSPSDGPLNILDFTARVLRILPPFSDGGGLVLKALYPDPPVTLLFDTDVT